MKLSVLDLVPVFGGAAHDKALEQARRLAQTAERLGYSRYWVAEHHDLAGLACTAPEVLLAHIGAVTTTIRLGSGALLLPHYSPMKVAESFRLLSTLYRDRIDLGIGRAPGGPAHASMALSGNFLEHVRRLPESLKDMLDLLNDQYELEGVPVRARPFPDVAPEVWLLGTNRKSAAYAAQFGLGYVFGQFMSDSDGAAVLESYRSAFQSAPWMSAPRTMIGISVVCAETVEEAEQLAAEAASWFKPAGASEPASSAKEPSAGAKLLAGTPERLARLLKELQQSYQADELMIVTPITDYDKRIRSYELLAAELIPSHDE